MYMDGPGNSEQPDDILNPVIDMFCANVDEGIAVYLQQIPNEDISFPDYPSPLGEDALIGIALAFLSVCLIFFPSVYVEKVFERVRQ